MLVFVLKIILAIFLPPAAAFWQVRLGTHFWVNVVLCFLGWIGAIVHALWLVLRERYKKLDIKRS